MAAAISNPEMRLLSLSAQDEKHLSWYMESAEGDVGRLKSGTLERGGSFSTVDYDKMTVRQCRAANLQIRLQTFRALVVAEDLFHWQTLSRYWSPECARVRVERERGQAGSGDTLAPLTAADREIRLVALYPYTRRAQEAGERFVFAERLRERAARIKAGPLRLVGAEETAQQVSEGLQSALDGPRDGENSFEYLVRRDAALAEVERQRTQGPWVPRPLAADELRDAAVRVLRDAERRKDVPFLSDVRVEAIRSYALAGDAWVRARRAVKGLDREEKQKKKADRWISENSCTRLKTDASDVAEALEAQRGRVVS